MSKLKCQIPACRQAGNPKSKCLNFDIKSFDIALTLGFCHFDFI